MAKLYTTEAAVRNSSKLLQLFGGWGYMWEYPVAKTFAGTRVMVSRFLNESWILSGQFLNLWPKGWKLPNQSKTVFSFHIKINPSKLTFTFRQSTLEHRRLCVNLSLVAFTESKAYPLADHSLQKSWFSSNKIDFYSFSAVSLFLSLAKFIDLKVSQLLSPHRLYFLPEIPRQFPEHRVNP